LRKEDDAAIEIPIEGTLDLHTFKPSDVKDLVPEYLRECIAKGIFRVRVVHGKGTGALARTVHSVLRKMPEIASFELAGPGEGAWGATIVRLKVP
jgi:dsDNA-specific endonuclease/ATPase MutS2